MLALPWLNTARIQVSPRWCGCYGRCLGLSHFLVTLKMTLTQGTMGWAMWYRVSNIAINKYSCLCKHLPSRGGVSFLFPWIWAGLWLALTKRMCYVRSDTVSYPILVFKKPHGSCFCCVGSQVPYYVKAQIRLPKCWGHKEGGPREWEALLDIQPQPSSQQSAAEWLTSGYTSRKPPEPSQPTKL